MDYNKFTDTRQHNNCLFYHTSYMFRPVNWSSADKTEYMVMSGDQNARRIQSVRINDSTFERVEEFKYLGTSLTYQNYIPEEIKNRMNLGNACYHSAQNLLSSRLLTKN